MGGYLMLSASSTRENCCQPQKNLNKPSKSANSKTQVFQVVWPTRVPLKLLLKRMHSIVSCSLSSSNLIDQNLIDYINLLFNIVLNQVLIQ